MAASHRNSNYETKPETPSRASATRSSCRKTNASTKTFPTLQPEVPGTRCHRWLPAIKTPAFSCRSFVNLCRLVATALSCLKTSAFSCHALAIFAICFISVCLAFLFRRMDTYMPSVRFQCIWVFSVNTQSLPQTCIPFRKHVFPFVTRVPFRKHVFHSVTRVSVRTRIPSR